MYRDWLGLQLNKIKENDLGTACGKVNIYN